jgi:hypothetical protein
MGTYLRRGPRTPAFGESVLWLATRGKEMRGCLLGNPYQDNHLRPTRLGRPTAVARR